jgi:hypothetical protein
LLAVDDNAFPLIQRRDNFIVALFLPRPPPPRRRQRLKWSAEKDDDEDDDDDVAPARAHEASATKVIIISFFN